MAEKRIDTISILFSMRKMMDNEVAWEKQNQSLIIFNSVSCLMDPHSYQLLLNTTINAI